MLHSWNSCTNFLGTNFLGPFCYYLDIMSCEMMIIDDVWVVWLLHNFFIFNKIENDVINQPQSQEVVHGCGFDLLLRKFGSVSQFRPIFSFVSIIQVVLASRSVDSCTHESTFSKIVENSPRFCILLNFCAFFSVLFYLFLKKLHPCLLKVQYALTGNWFRVIYCL